MKRSSTCGRLSLLVACALLFLPARLQADHHEEDGKTAAALKTVIDGAHRAEADKVRDKYRHPLETLTWFGIKDNMTVVEIWPGGGWYTDILAPVPERAWNVLCRGA